MKQNSILFIAILATLTNCCHKTTSFNFENDKDQYENTVALLTKEYSVIFDTTKMENSNSIYRKDIEKFKGFESIISLMDKNSIEFITIDRDSTISFYKYFSEGIKSKQGILFHLDSNTKPSSASLRNLSSVNELGNGFYETERTISLAQ
jgi:hypothetical protein